VNPTELVQGLTGPALYAAVGGFALLESAAFVGLVIPGETAMLLGGALAALGHAQLPLMIVAAIAGAILGDLAGYGMGRGIGAPLRRSRWGRAVSETHWQRADDLVRRRGPLAVFVGRWVGLLRALVPFVAGSTRMPVGRFLLWNVLGGVTWATTVMVAGYLAGASWTVAERWLGLSATVLGVILGVLLAGYVGRWLWQRRRTAPAPVLGQGTVGTAPEH
jgi:membrane-associated protein